MRICRLLIVTGAFTLIFWLSGCANQSVVTGDNYVNFELDYEFATQNNLILKRTFNEEGLQFIFPVIPGALFGNPSTTILTVSSAQEGKLLLQPPRNADDHAKPVEFDLENTALTIEPEGVEFLRLGTFHRFPDSRGLGGGGFISKKTGDFLLLIYISKSTRFNGQVYSLNDGLLTTYDFSLKGKGWHWLVSKKISPLHYHLKEYKPVHCCPTIS